MTRSGDAPEWLKELDAEPEAPVCPLCAGRGWVRRDVPVTHPDFGRAFPCSCQEEASAGQRLGRLLRFSNLGMLASVRFDDLNPQGPGAGPEAQARYGIALDVARKFAEASAGVLLLTGGHGVGKTHLAAAAANRLIERGQPVFFAFVPDLLDQLRGSYSPDSELSFDELFDLVKNVPTLVLDDLGGHSGAAWAEEKLFQIINHRYVSNLPTIVTSSVPVDRLDGRLQTRLTDSRWSRVIDLGGSARAGTTAMGAIEPTMRQSMTFASFSPEGRNLRGYARETLKAAYDAAWSFAEDPRSWLVLLGDTGCGKTHLAVAVANVQLERGREVFYALVSDLLDDLRETYSPDSRVTYDEQFDRVKQAPLLILDDWGVQSSTPWAQEKLYQIVVHRHHARLPTIFTMREIPNGENDPIASRLNDSRVSTVCIIQAPDYRPSGNRGRGRSSR